MIYGPRYSSSAHTKTMKLSHLQFPTGRSSVVRASLTIAACAAAAALAFAAPQRLTSGATTRGAAIPESAVDLNVPGAVPPSMDEFATVMVELDATPAAVIYGEALKAAQATASTAPVRVPMSAAARGESRRVEIDSASAARVQNHVSTLDAAQQALVPAIVNAGGHVVYRVQRVYNGIAVRIPAARVAELSKLPGVKSVRALTRAFPTAFTDIDFTGARSFWKVPYSQGVGIHGEGIKIAMIDTGVDYTHTNFGGPGTANYAGITDKGPVPNAYYPNAKFPFGIDLAGNDYNADNDPQPDQNPLDSNGHGTGTASLSAGYGVNAGGTTYHGNYDDLTPIASMKISPGYAPLAQIVPVKIFGTNGGTFLSTAGIEYAMDPNGDGNFNDRVDVISQSVGPATGNFPADAPESVAAQNAVTAGVVYVNSAGNSYETFYVTGGAGSAPGAITTAASFNDQAGFIADAVVEGVSQNVAGQRAYALFANSSSPRGPVTGKVVAARPADASGPLTNAAFISGNICYVDRGGGFAAAANNCQAAGAIGIIIGNNRRPPSPDTSEPVGQSTTGATLTVPDVMVSTTDGDFIKNFSQFNATTGEPSNPIVARIRPENVAVQRGTGNPDTMAAYSSRGPLAETNTLKPDVTAPGEIVGTAETGTGNGVMLFNGTSSACPHVAGTMALIRQLHPTWTVEEMKALVMNTATHDLFTGNNQTGARHGVSRVGAGRLDAGNASRGNVVVFNRTDPGQVSVSFGNVEVPVDGSVATSKQVTIRNKGGTAVTYNASYQSIDVAGDSNFSAPQSQFTVPANSEITFPVLFRATGSTLKHTRGPDVPTTQPTSAGNLARAWLTEAAGYGVFTPTSGSEPAIRIPLYATVKPVSAMRTTQNSVTPGSNTSPFTLTLTGTPLNTGTSYPIDIISYAKAFELQYVHPNAATPNFSTDQNVIKYVGVTSDYANRPASNKQPTVLTFALEGFGDASTPDYTSTDKEIYIDVNFDGIDDYVLYPGARRNSNSTNNPHTNAYTPVLQNLNTGAAFNVGFYTQLLSPGSRDTNTFNNSVLLMAVNASLLGYTGQGQSFFQYHVVSFNFNNEEVSETPYMRFDIAKPGVDATGPSGALEPFYYNDVPNTNIPVNYNGANYQANGSKGILMVHMHNGRGARTEAISIRSPRITGFSPDHGYYGQFVTIYGENFGNDTAVTFSPNVPAQRTVLSNSAISAQIPAGATTGPITVSNSAGSSTSQQSFQIVPAPSPSPSPTATASPQGRVGTGAVRARGGSVDQ